MHTTPTRRPPSLLVLLAVIVTVVAAAAPWSWETADAAPQVLLQPSTLAPGETLTISGVGFNSVDVGSPATVLVDQTLVGTPTFVQCSPAQSLAGIGSGCNPADSFTYTLPRSIPTGTHSVTIGDSKFFPVATFTVAVTTPTATPIGGTIGLPTATDTPLVINTEVPSPTPVRASVTPIPTPTRTVTPIDIPGTGDASPLIDGHLDRGWLTTHVHGGYATVGFAHGAVERITGFVIDCSATDGAPATADLQRFEVLFSAQSAQPGSFITGVNDTCLQQTGLQRFTLQNPVVAKYVQLQLVSNFGNPALTGVAEFEALGRVVTSAVSGAQSRLLHAHLVAHVPGPSRAAPLGRVREIVRGLGVQPPHQQVQVGKVKQPVYSQYSLHTKVAQRADVQFADGTMLYVAQSTDAVLASPSKTVVKAGVAEQKLQPGTTHRIQTSQVTADAIGTDFVTVAQKTRTVVYVVEGSVLVHNKYGRAVVKTGQYTTVDAGSAPTAPLSFSSSSTPDPAAWAASLVDPQLSENVALDANGGFIAGTSG